MNNDDNDLKRRAMRIGDFLDQIDDLKADLKVEMKAAKSAGYDLKAIRQVIREARADDEKVQAQLEFELVVETYREAVGLKTRSMLELGHAAAAVSAVGEVSDGAGNVVLPYRGKVAAAGA